jgi:hypothetical protein
VKNFLSARFQPISGTEHVGFRAFRVRFVVALNPTPTFSTGRSVPSSSRILCRTPDHEAYAVW